MSFSPLIQFKSWYQEAGKGDIKYPNAMVLSTCTHEGKPSSRVVLLKEVDELGFVFFTNYQSKKGVEIERNPYVSLNFYWQHLGKQVRIEGKAEKVSEQLSDEYFETRPRQSQLGAWASKQSQELTSRFKLLRDYLKYSVKYASKDVERPKHWGGYRVIPETIEFWQEKSYRLHHRTVYKLENNRWTETNVYP